MTTTSPPNQGAHHGADGGSPGSHKVRDDVHRTVDDARQDAAGRVDGIAESIDAAATHLGQEDMTRLSGYVHDMAQSLSGFSRDLREKSGDEVLQDIKHLARRNPALFLGGSVAIGFGLSRFARATRSRERHMPVPMDQARTDFQPTAGAPTGGAPTGGASAAGAPTPGATAGPAASTSPTTSYARPAASPSSTDYGDLP